MSDIIVGWHSLLKLLYGERLPFYCRTTAVLVIVYQYLHIIFLERSMSLQSKHIRCLLYRSCGKKSLICSAALTTAEIYSLLYCGAFLFTMHVVAEKMRWRLDQELFQLAHKEDFNLLLNFWVHLGGELWFAYLLWFCAAIAGGVPSGLFEDSSIIPWNGLKFYYKGG